MQLAQTLGANLICLHLLTTFSTQMSRGFVVQLLVSQEPHGVGSMVKTILARVNAISPLTLHTAR